MEASWGGTSPGRPGALPASHCCPSADRWHSKRHDRALSHSRRHETMAGEGAGMMAVGDAGHHDYTTHGGFFFFSQLFIFPRELHTHRIWHILSETHMHTHTCACTHAHLYLSHTHTESDTEVRIMDLSEQLWCGMCGRYFILPPGQMSPWLWHLTASSPSVQSTITSQLSPCLPGTGLISQQRWEHIQPARVMHHDGNGGQENIWTQAHIPSPTPKDSVFTIPHITIPPVLQIGVVVMVLQVAVSVRGVTWCCCFTPERHPSALEQLPLWWHWHVSISIKPENAAGWKV